MPAPVSTTEQQQLTTGDEQMVSHSPPIHSAVSLSSRRTQTIPQNLNHHTTTSPPEGQGGSTLLNESEKVGSYDRSQATIQDPVSGPRRGQRSGRTPRKLSRRTTAPLKPFPLMPIDLQSSDPRELQQGQTHTQVDGYLGGVGQSRTNLQSTPGDRNTSRRGISGKGSREPSVRDGDEGWFWPEVPQNDLETSRMLIILIPAYPMPDPVRGPVLNVAGTTQGYYPNRSSSNPFRT